MPPRSSCGGTSDSRPPRTSADDLPDDPAELKRLLAEARGENFALRTLARIIKEDTGIDVL